MPFPGESELLKSSPAIRLSEYGGKAAGALNRGPAESRQRDYTEPAFVFGLLRPHESRGWGCNLLEDWNCWVVEVGDAGQCKP